jgi:hypothetical protein
MILFAIVVFLLFGFAGFRTILHLYQAKGTRMALDKQSSELTAAREEYRKTIQILHSTLDNLRVQDDITTTQRELDYHITSDALAREKRAKAALEAVLRTTGCTDAQVEDVLRSIDHAEEMEG